MAPTKAELANKITTDWPINSVVEALPQRWLTLNISSRRDEEWDLEFLEALAKLSGLQTGSNGLKSVRRKMIPIWKIRNSHRYGLSIGKTWELKKANILTDTRTIIDAIEANKELAEDFEEEVGQEQNITEGEDAGDTGNSAPRNGDEEDDYEEGALETESNSQAHAPLNTDGNDLTILGTQEKRPLTGDGEGSDLAERTTKRRKISDGLDDGTQRVENQPRNHATDQTQAQSIADEATAEIAVPEARRTLAPDEVVTENFEKKTAIEDYWDLQGGCKEVVPEHMRPGGEPETWGATLKLLPELYKLARITYRRHSEVVVVLRQSFDKRPGKEKVLCLKDIKAAYKFFDVDNSHAEAGPSGTATTRRTRQTSRARSVAAGSSGNAPSRQTPSIPPVVAGPSGTAPSRQTQPVVAGPSGPAPSRPPRQPSQTQPPSTLPANQANPPDRTPTTTPSRAPTAPTPPSTLHSLLSHPHPTTLLHTTRTSPAGTLLFTLGTQIEAADREVRILECELEVLRVRRARVNAFALDGEPLVVESEIAEKEKQVQGKKGEILGLRRRVGEVVGEIEG